MKYNFDEIIDRRNTDCLKYDFAAERGKPEDVLPLWVADIRRAGTIIFRRSPHGTVIILTGRWRRTGW